MPDIHFLANVKEHAPPPVKSGRKETEELYGGCCGSSCSPSSFLYGPVELLRIVWFVLELRCRHRYHQMA